MSPDVIVSYDSHGTRTERPKLPHAGCGGLFDSRPDRDASICRVCKSEADGERAFVDAGHAIRSQVDDALTTKIGAPNPGSRMPVVRAVSFRHDGDGDVLVHPAGMGFEVAVDDPLALLAVCMAAIKFGHPPEMLEAAQALVAAFKKEPTR